MISHQLHNPNQSAYRRDNSMETSLVKVVNDLLLALDANQCVFLLMLDLSAAFDTVEHAVLLNRFESDFGINGSARS